MQRLLKEACINDEGLFSSFLNRLFNTLSWAMTEFSVSVREMQEKYQVWYFFPVLYWIWFLVSFRLLILGDFKSAFCSSIIVHTQGLGFQFYVLTLVAYQFFNSNL